MNIVNRYKFFRALFMSLLVAVLVLGGFGNGDLKANAYECNAVENITGDYQCSGQCVITGDSGRELISVSGETDTINFFSSMSEYFYQVDIVGGTIEEPFFETEIGPLIGTTLWTATAEVNDGEYPVLEEYLFDTDGSCNATGFTKIVRNPSEEHFKTCFVYCDIN